MVSLRGVLLVWIGLMGLAATAASLVLLRLFPRAFSDTGRALVWPWQASASRPARSRGWLVLAAVLLSACVVIVGIILLLA
ncbi:hypothetical protein JXD38_04925 [candidate division WOR-3 bacterium]|nr:hypothetical protein [candidate division WOR-3 bacterium]